MTKEDKIILKLPELFGGLEKIEMLDILLKTEKIINTVEKFTSKEVHTAMNLLKHPDIIEYTDNSFYQLIDHVNDLRIYKKDFYKSFFKFHTPYYYTTIYDKSPKKLTKDNLLRSTKGTKLHAIILEYLFNNKLTKRNRKTNRLAILEFLEEKQ